MKGEMAKKESRNTQEYSRVVTLSTTIIQDILIMRGDRLFHAHDVLGSDKDVGCHGEFPQMKNE